MFRRLRDEPQMLTLTVNSRQITACIGDSVAAALLLAGQQVFRRTMLSGEARGPYCAMGTCFECLVTIDGQPSVQACLTKATQGMVIETAEP